MTLVVAERARTFSQPEKFGGPVFFTPGRVATLQSILGDFDGDLNVATADTRINYEWNSRVVAASLDYTPLGPIDPWSIPEHYSETGNEGELAVVNGDWTTAVDLAVRYNVLGEAAAAEAVADILTAWSTISSFATNSGSLLNWNDKWPMMIQAAMMVRDHAAYTPGLHDALQDVTDRSRSLTTAFRYNNNWGAWGVCFELASAMFLDERPRFNRAIQRWRTLFDVAVVDDVPVDEIYRQSSGQGDGSFGLWYSNFFLYGMTVAAEWARFGGEWLYDYTGKDGSTFRGLAENIRYWTRYPNLYPYNSSGTPSETVRILAHDDILHALWPSEESAWLLANFPTGSVRDCFGMRQAVLAYRGRPLYG